MKEKLEQIRREALEALEQTKAAQDLEALRVKYLGKKGELTAVLKQMGSLSAEERPVIGELANNVREALTDALARRQKAIEEAALRGGPQAPHVHRPGRAEGHLRWHGLPDRRGAGD